MLWFEVTNWSTECRGSILPMLWYKAVVAAIRGINDYTVNWDIREKGSFATAFNLCVLSVLLVAELGSNTGEKYMAGLSPKIKF